MGNLIVMSFMPLFLMLCEYWLPKTNIDITLKSKKEWLVVNK